MNNVALLLLFLFTATASCIISTPLANNLILDLSSYSSYRIAIAMYFLIITSVFLVPLFLLKKRVKSFVLIIGLFVGILFGSVLSIMLGVYF